jgi:hypothetical protein
MRRLAYSVLQEVAHKALAIKGAVVFEVGGFGFTRF